MPDQDPNTISLVSLAGARTQAPKRPVFANAETDFNQKIAVALHEEGFSDITTLDQGGMGIVFKAKNVVFGRTVVIKVPIIDPAASRASDQLRKIYERFINECRVTGNLGKSGLPIVMAHSCGELSIGESRIPYLELEYVEGTTFRHAIDLLFGGKERNSPLRKFAPEVSGFTTTAFLQACRGIQAMHEPTDSRGPIVHRDLKPGNIMLRASSDAKEGKGSKEAVILDFGLAKELQKSDPLATTIGIIEITQVNSGTTLVGEILGTPAYMSPEQSRGENDTLDQRSDIYALGAILYEILTGERPYQRTTSGSNAIQLLAQIGDDNQNPASIREINPLAPLELVAIAEKSMRKALNERYRIVGDLIADIQRYRDGHVVQALADKLPDATARFKYRANKVKHRISQGLRVHARLAITSTIVGIVAVGILVWAATSWSSANAKRVADQKNRAQQQENLLRQYDQAKLALENVETLWDAGASDQAKSEISKCITLCQNGSGTTFSDLNSKFEELQTAATQRRTQLNAAVDGKIIHDATQLIAAAKTEQSKSLDEAFQELRAAEASLQKEQNALNALLNNEPSNKEKAVSAELALQGAKTAVLSCKEKLNQAIADQKDDLNSARETLNKTIILLDQQPPDSKFVDVRGEAEAHLEALSTYEEILKQVELLESWTHTDERFDDLDTELIEELARAREMFSSISNSDHFTEGQNLLLKEAGEKLQISNLLAHVPSLNFQGTSEQLKVQYKRLFDISTNIIHEQIPDDMVAAYYEGERLPGSSMPYEFDSYSALKMIEIALPHIPNELADDDKRKIQNLEVRLATHAPQSTLDFGTLAIIKVRDAENLARDVSQTKSRLSDAYREIIETCSTCIDERGQDTVHRESSD